MSKFSKGDLVEGDFGTVEITTIDQFGNVPHYGVIVCIFHQDGRMTYDYNTKGWVPCWLLDDVGNKVD